MQETTSKVSALASALNEKGWSFAFEKLVSDILLLKSVRRQNTTFHIIKQNGQVKYFKKVTEFVTWSGTAKPRETSHTNEVNAGPGQRGTIVQFH
jgi:hypothetical protein